MDTGTGENREAHTDTGRISNDRESIPGLPEEGDQSNRGIELDPFQIDILKAEGNLCICSGRQVGKSTVVAIKAAEYAYNHPKKFTLIVSVTEDQSERFIALIVAYLKSKYKERDLWNKKDKPLKGQIKLKNGSVIRSKPIGTTGFGTLGYTVDLLIADEAAFMPEAVWNAVTPMLLTTGGAIILISTPNVAEGYFYKAYTDPEYEFKTFHINAEEVAAGRKEPQRSIMQKKLSMAKKTMTEREYARWYLAIFQDSYMQYYSDDTIGSTPTRKRPEVITKQEYFLGVDVARYGGDETTFQVIMKRDDMLYHVENIFQTHTSLTWTTRKIQELNNKYNFKKIGLDTGGVGAGIFDNLLEIESVRGKIVDCNASKKSVEYYAKPGKKDPEKRRLLKDDMHANLLRLMEAKKIVLLDDDEVRVSLKSVLFEHNPETGKMKIFGSKTHIVEGLIRACEVAKEKNIRIWVDYV